MNAHNDNPVDGEGGRRGLRWDLLLAAVLWTPLLAVYVWSIGRMPLDFDEYRTLFVVRESLPTLMSDRLSNGHQPLYFLAAWLFARVAGSESLIALRALPLAACFVALGFLYGTVRSVANKYAAVIAVALCLLSGAFMWVSHNARPGSFLAMFVMAGTYFMVSAGDKPGTRRMVLIGLMSLLALLSYNADIPVVGVQIVGVLFTGRARWRLLIPQLVAAAVFVPWFIYTTMWYEAKAPLSWLTQGELIHWPGAVLDFTYNFDLQATARGGGIPGVLVFLFWACHLALIVYGFTRVKRFAVLFGLMWSAQLGYGLYSLMIKNLNPMQIERYFVISVLFQAVAIAIALTTPPPRFVWPKMPAVFCAVALIVSAIGFTRNYSEPVPTRDMDLVRHIQSVAPDTELVYVYQNPNLRYQLDYFLEADVHLFARVYGLPTSGNIQKFGEPAVEVGTVMSPPPHEGVDELFFVVHREELLEKPRVTHFAVTDAMREKLDELIASYDRVEITELESGRVYRLRR